uniref:Uncharacterized protein n=1 Tax=viral metagenome TaxID=1070528 RepID=A0A6C0KXM2_9ZZZZ
MDIENLLKALDNENNSKFLNLTNEKIKKIKIEILKEIQLPNDEIITYMNKLKEYIYIDEMCELKLGGFIRWISIKDPNEIYLTSGAILSEINVTDNGVLLNCKNFAKKHYQIKLDECLVFQKLNQQEMVLLSALDSLSK